MTGSRAAALAVMLSLTVPGLSSCSGDQPGAEAPPQAMLSAAPSPRTPGAVAVSFAGGPESFELSACSSAGDDSIAATGQNGHYLLTISLVDGAGDFVLAPIATTSAPIDGVVSQVAVSADGTFDVSGTYPTSQGAAEFTASGTCGTLAW